MKTLFASLLILSVTLSTILATEQETVDRSASTIREFRHMPGRGIPAHILVNAEGLAIISVLKAGLIVHGNA